MTSSSGRKPGEPFGSKPTAVVPMHVRHRRDSFIRLSKVCSHSDDRSIVEMEVSASLSAGNHGFCCIYSRVRTFHSSGDSVVTWRIRGRPCISYFGRSPPITTHIIQPNVTKKYERNTDRLGNPNEQVLSFQESPSKASIPDKSIQNSQFGNHHQLQTTENHRNHEDRLFYHCPPFDPCDKRC